MRRARAVSAQVARVALIAVDAVASVTAIGGGLALATGLEGERFPIAWLQGTPFGSYLPPGLILAGAVGGTAAAATVATLLRPRLGGSVSVAAGVVLAGWIVGEILILTRDPGPVSTVEASYLALGAAMIGLGLAVSRSDRLRRAPD